MQHKHRLAALLLALNGLYAASALAADDVTPMESDKAQPPAEAAAPAAPAPDWTFPMTVSLVSDYIFRGQSQTWGKPAAQFSIEADHKSGVYAGFATSNVSEKWLPGANLETDFYAGFRNKIGETDFSYDLGGIYYVYIGGNWDKSPFIGSNSSNSLNTAEFYGALSYKWLTVKSGITATDYFGWNTNNSAPASEPSNAGVGDFNGNPKAGVTGSTKGSYYYELDGAYEFIPTWTVSGQAGRQVIKNSVGLDINYYKVGVSKAFSNGWALAGFYSASSEPAAYKNFLSLANGRGQSDIAQDKFFVSLSKSF